MAADLERIALWMEKRHFTVQVLQSAQEARQAALKLITPQAKVGFGGSVTVDSLGLYEQLKEDNHPVYWHWKVPSEATAQMRMDAFMSDFYLTSANAVTQDGMLVNIDGSGNRVGATQYGPAIPIFIIGRNKISGSLDQAIARVKNVACPQNARRLGLNTPCAATDQCNECTGPHRMCNITAILTGKPNAKPALHVLLVREDLGY